MKNVKRLSMPESLKKNAANWTRNLLSKIEECNRNKTEVPDAFYNYYNQKDVKERLKIMYNGLCCYCESRTGVVEFGHIEHRKPKKKFPKDTYNWHNLHLGCTRCNTKKGEKYSAKYPILDAVKDTIPKYLTYAVNSRGVWPKALKKRGETTIQLADLNDEKLRKGWTEVFNEAIGLIIKKNTLQSNSPGISKIKTELEEMCSDVYGSVVDFAMQACLRV
jgi:uncharacterized protein (TIGR02646 family)